MCSIRLHVSLFVFLGFLGSFEDVFIRISEFPKVLLSFRGGLAVGAACMLALAFTLAHG